VCVRVRVCVRVCVCARARARVRAYIYIKIGMVSFSLLCCARCLDKGFSLQRPDPVPVDFK
jgi:hypothetical protein